MSVTDRTRRGAILSGLACVILLICHVAACRPGTMGKAQDVEGARGESAVSTAGWPARVLITNDDGFDDPALLALVRAFSGRAETYLVAPAVDRSGTSNFMSVVQNRSFRVERRDIGDDRVVAYALDGYPGDCITFAVTGPLREKRPDLVISGINGGPNLGDAWFMSGTVGAARTAAYYDIPAIAVSGVDKDDAAAIEAAVDWVVRLASSEVVRSLRPPEYLTVSLPLLPAEEIRGVRVVRRSGTTLMATTRLETTSGVPGAPELWAFDLVQQIEGSDPDTDAAAVANGYIAVVGMRADENDTALRSSLQRNAERFPAWRVPASK